MNIKKFFESNLYKKALIGVAVLVLMVIAFGAGVSIGYRKAQFSLARRDGFSGGFNRPRHGIFGLPSDRDFMNPHGTFGTITTLNLPGSTINITDRDGSEKTILLSSSTIIHGPQGPLQPVDLKADEQAVVVGSPNNSGQIEARLIKIIWP